jgi:hypothetical protein
MQAGSTIVRGVQLLWIVLLVALLGNVIYDNINGRMSAINYAMFATVIAWLACLLGIAAGFVSMLSEGALGLGLMVLDGLAILFTFIAAIVLPAKLKAVNCGGDLSTEKRGSDWIGFGSENPEKRCRELQASTVFMWFLFFTLAGSLGLGLITGRRGGRSSGGSSAPGMSQVRV